MDYKEAYSLLKQKFPDHSAKTCVVCKDLFLFNMIPDSMDMTQDGVGFYDNTWSVNKSTGEMKQLSFLDNLEMISNATMLDIE